MKRLCYELEQIELYDNYRCIIITYTNVIIGKRSEIDFDVELGEEYTYKIVKEKSMTPERWIKEVTKHLHKKGLSSYQEIDC